jgi:hypothetical protein
MKKLLGVAVLLVALAAFVVTAAAADTGGSDRPFTGKLAGSAAVVPDANCPIGLRTLSEGSGAASHLGFVSMSSSHCTPVTNVITGGQMTLVAADGDEVHATYSGACVPFPFPPVGENLTCGTENVIVGGTGRFANATGVAHVTALVTWLGFGAPVLPATWTWGGTISY